MFYSIRVLFHTYYNLIGDSMLVQQLVSNKWYSLIRYYLFIGLPFFSMGLVIPCCGKMRRKVAVGLYLLFFVLFVAELYLCRSYGLSDGKYTTSFFLYPFTALTVTVLMNTDHKLFCNLQNILVVVYLVHPLVISAVHLVFAYGNVTVENIIITIATIVISIGVSVICIAFSKRKKSGIAI